MAKFSEQSKMFYSWFNLLALKEEYFHRVLSKLFLCHRLICIITCKVVRVFEAPNFSARVSSVA